MRRLGISEGGFDSLTGYFLQPGRAGAPLALMRPISRFESGGRDFAGGPALGRVS